MKTPSTAEEDRWEFANGVTFTTFNQKTTQNLSSSNFVKARVEQFSVFELVLAMTSSILKNFS